MKYLQADGWTQGFGVTITKEQWDATFKPFNLKGRVKVYFKDGKKVVEQDGKIVTESSPKLETCPLCGKLGTNLGFKFYCLNTVCRNFKP